MTLVAAILLSTACGFIALSYEILWYRAISFVSGGSPLAFGMLLGYYLIGLAFGARLTRPFYTPAMESDVASQRLALGAFILGANLVGFAVLPALAAAAVWLVWPLALLAIAISAAMLGAVLPLTSHLGIAPDANAGAKVSYLYVSNIVGSAAGTLLTGFVLLEHLPIASIGLVLLLVGISIAVPLLIRSGLARVSAIIILATAAAWITPLVYDHFYERLLYKQQFTHAMQFANLVENRSGVIAVTRDGIVYGGGAYDGRVSTDLASDSNAIERGYAVSSFSRTPKRILVIGLSTGAWAQVLANMPGLDSMTVIEINGGYLQLIEQYPQVRSLLRNKRVRVVIDDGRRWLARNPTARFDAIVSNTTFHWRAHVTNLLSAEFLLLARRHLFPGGILYYNTTWSGEALKTGLTAFPYGFRLNSFVALSDVPFALDRTRMMHALTHWRIDDRPVLPGGTSGLTALNHALSVIDTTTPGDPRRAESRADALARVGNLRTVTDDNMWTEWWPLRSRLAGVRAFD